MNLICKWKWKRKSMLARRCLGTIIRNTGLNFCVELGKWLTPEAQYVAMGFPVTLTQQIMSGSICHVSKLVEENDQVVTDCVFMPRKRTRRSLTHQVGNSMHVNSVGAAMFMMVLFCPSLGDRQERQFPNDQATKAWYLPGGGWVGNRGLGISHISSSSSSSSAPPAAPAIAWEEAQVHAAAAAARALLNAHDVAALLA